MFKALSMHADEQVESLKALHDIRGIMERSARFISLSGWSGVWAGCTALAGAVAGYYLLPSELLEHGYFTRSEAGQYDQGYHFSGAAFYEPLLLGIVIFLLALAGGYYFTWRKTQHQGGTIWNHASRQMIWALAVPLIAGAIFTLGFMRYGHGGFIAPACLTFYGLSLVNGSKYTLSDIKYLGYLEVLLGCICLFVPGWGLYFWALGFGVLHILYGIIMWNKYDKKVK